MYLATAGERVCLLKTDNYELHKTYLPVNKQEKGMVRDLSWSHDGKYFGIVVDGSPSVELYRVKEDIIPIESFRIVDPTSIAFSKHGNGIVAIGTGNGVVHAINYINSNAPKHFNSCCSKITSMDFNLTDSSIAAGTNEGKVHIYGMQSNKRIGVFELRSKKVISCVKFHYFRKGILSVACQDGSVTVWDINFGTVEGQYMCHSAPCSGVVFSPLNKTFMASVGFDAAVCCYDLKSKEKILTANIPEPGSSLDIPNDGLTVAVGTVHGSVFVYDLRKLRNPLYKFHTRSGITKVVYQPLLKESRRSLLNTPHSSAPGKFALQRLSLESNSSSGDIFSPLHGDGAIFSPLHEDGAIFSPKCGGDPSYLTSNNLGKIKSESLMEKFNRDFSNEISNIVHPSKNATYSPTRKSRARKLDNHANLTIADLWNESPKSTHCFKDNDSGDNSRPTEGCIIKNRSEEMLRNDFVSKLSIQSCPQDTISSTNGNSAAKNTKSLSKSNHYQTERLVDISNLNESKDDEDIDNDSPLEQNLISCQMPFDSPVNTIQHSKIEELKNKYSVRGDDVDLEIIELEESQPEKVKESSVMEVTESPDKKDLNVELDDILNKYSLSNQSLVKDRQNLSLTFESPVVLDNQEKARSNEKSEVISTEELPEVADTLDLSSKESSPEKSSVDPLSTLDGSRAIKEYINGMINDLKVDLQRQNFVMHEHNILAHLKQEMKLNMILSHLEKKVADKSVGTDDL